MWQRIKVHLQIRNESKSLKYLSFKMLLKLLYLKQTEIYPILPRLSVEVVKIELSFF